MRLLFLDLEDTVITPVMEGWHNFEVINLTTIKEVIARFRPDVVDIFSFAIHDNYQRDLFNKYTRPTIEKLLGVKLSSVPTVDIDIKKAVCRQKGISPEKTSFSDMCEFWGKDLAFQLYAQERFGTSDKAYPIDVIFLDDAVKSSLFQTLDRHITAYTLNIDELVRNFDYASQNVPFLQPVSQLEINLAAPSAPTISLNSEPSASKFKF